MVLLTLRRASTLARVAWKPKATLSGRLEGLLQAPAEKEDPAAAERLKQWLSGKRHVVVLTGAGLSTDSGIPDYRGKAGSYRLGMLSVYSKVPSTADTHSSVSTQAMSRLGTTSSCATSRRGGDIGRGRWSGIPHLRRRNPTTRTSQLPSSRPLALSTRSSPRTSTVFTRPRARGT